MSHLVSSGTVAEIYVQRVPTSLTAGRAYHDQFDEVRNRGQLARPRESLACVAHDASKVNVNGTSDRLFILTPFSAACSRLFRPTSPTVRLIDNVNA